MSLDPFRRVLSIIDSQQLIQHRGAKLPDDTPLREVLPGIWPTMGDLRNLVVPWQPIELLATLNPDDKMIIWRRKRLPSEYSVGLAYKSKGGRWLDVSEPRDITEFASDFMLIPEDPK